jgi:dephospho-CoA kinase
MRLKIIGIVGMPGSGKSEAADVARELEIPVLVMGDVIRGEAERLGLEPSDENLGRIATQLRENEGAAAVARRCLQRLADKFGVLDIDHFREPIDSGKDLVVVEGIRSKEEVDYFRKNCQDFHLVEIWTPPMLRLKRVSERGRSDDPTSEKEKSGLSDAQKESFQKALSVKLDERDQRELGWGMGEAFQMADLRIKNECDLKEFRALMRKTLKEMKANLI